MTDYAPPTEGVSSPPAFDLRHYLENVSDYYHPGRPGRIHPRHEGHGVMPLWRFPEDHLENILDAATGRREPSRWYGERGIFQMESRAWHEWHWRQGRRLRADPDYSPRGRRHIPDALRSAVYERDGSRCLHCGTDEALSLDHIYPYSLGGQDTIDNLQTLCRPCNSRKGVRV